MGESERNAAYLPIGTPTRNSLRSNGIASTLNANAIANTVLGRTLAFPFSIRMAVFEPNSSSLRGGGSPSQQLTSSSDSILNFAQNYTGLKENTHYVLELYVGTPSNNNIIARRCFKTALNTNVFNRALGDHGTTIGRTRAKAADASPSAARMIRFMRACAGRGTRRASGGEPTAMATSTSCRPTGEQPKAAPRTDPAGSKL